MTLKKHIEWLQSLKRFKPKTSLLHLKEVFEALDLSYPSKKIQVVGTNGKGSTAKMLTDIVKDTHTVGTFMSPYVYQFNERLLINGKSISDDLLSEAFLWIKDVYKTYDFLTFFECLTLIAFYVFKRLHLDIIIMEAGIGGKLDSTSIETYDMTLFTSVGHDHLHILGPTLHDVCLDKVQAVKEGGVLLSNVNETFHDIIKKHTQTVGATYVDLSQSTKQIISHYPLSFIYDSEVYTLNYVGDHYVQNGILAIEAAKRLGIDDTRIKYGLLSSSLQGRFERFNNVILDAAHNIDAIEALTKTIETVFENQGVYILFSALKDKKVMPMINTLETVGTVITTSFDDPRYDDLSFIKAQDKVFIPSMEDSYEYIKRIMDEDAVIVVTGSIHFISQFKSNCLNTF